jgi:C4-dicarboxylate transporter/malic acid transport protein
MTSFIDSKPVRNFGAQWFSAVMGTGALAISMFLASSRFTFFLMFAQLFLFLSIGMFLFFLILWTIKILYHFKKVKKELHHPIIGNFFPTIPISLIVIGIALNSIGPTLFNSSLILFNTLLFVIGSLGVFIFGWLILSIIFVHKKIDLEHANYGWFIPPVSHLIIPVLGLSLINQYTSSTLADIVFIISIVAFGVGFLLFLFVGSIIYHRYIYHELPISRLAPTFMIGLAPTSIITIILVKLVDAVKNVSFDIQPNLIVPMIKIISVMMWGFSAWWFILAVILLLHYLKNRDHPFVFGWWAYTFPIAAFTISNGAINHLLDYQLFEIILQIFNILLLAVWIIVFFKTLKAVKKGKCFEEHK